MHVGIASARQAGVLPDECLHTLAAVIEYPMVPTDGLPPDVVELLYLVGVAGGCLVKRRLEQAPVGSICHGRHPVKDSLVQSRQLVVSIPVVCQHGARRQRGSLPGGAASGGIDAGLR